MTQCKIAFFDGIDERKLMDLYQESNVENIDYFYPDISDRSLGLQKVERKFLDYIKTSFFGKEGNEYRILEEEHIWISALRLYRIKEGFYYIEALETHPAFRKKGYGSYLLNSVIEDLKRQGAFQLCDCVGKRNEASIRTHQKCGFEIVPGPAYDYVREETDEACCGMRYVFGLDR